MTKLEKSSKHAGDELGQVHSKFGLEVEVWCWMLKFEAKLWCWSLKFEVEVWSLKLKLKFEIEGWSWSL